MIWDRRQHGRVILSGSAEFDGHFRGGRSVPVQSLAGKELDTQGEPVRVA
jgi:hypothetical protein